MPAYRSIPRKPPVPTGLNALSKAELVALAQSRGVDASGTKADLVKRLKS